MKRVLIVTIGHLGPVDKRIKTFYYNKSQFILCLQWRESIEDKEPNYYTMDFTKQKDILSSFQSVE